MRSIGLRTAAALTALTACAAPVGAAEGLDLSPAGVPIDQIVPGGPGKDGIPAIVRPRFVTAADSEFLADEDRVVGIARRGEAKAYPLRILNWHQVVNDTFAHRRIAVTYCPLTGSAVVFRRRFGGVEHTFGVSGRVYEGNMLMYDHETASLWSQLASIALTGDHMGDHLPVLPSVVADWGNWRRDHPSSLVLAPDHGHARDYTRNPYLTYEVSSSPMFSPARRDDRVPDKERVLGVTLGGRDRAYPLSELQYAASPVREKLGPRDVVISFDGRNAMATVDGRLAPATSMFWFAWTAFHPMTTVWHAPLVEPLDGPVRNSDVTIEEQKSYWTRLPCTLTAGPEHQPLANTGLYVISGKLKNASDLPLHHIRLRFDLLDPGGLVVYHEEGYNRSAEALMELEEGAVAVGEPEQVRDIPPGGIDTFRMIMIGDEIPPFDHSDVTVVSAR